MAETAEFEDAKKTLIEIRRLTAEVQKNQMPGQEFADAVIKIGELRRQFFGLPEDVRDAAARLAQAGELDQYDFVAEGKKIEQAQIEQGENPKLLARCYLFVRKMFSILGA